MAIRGTAVEVNRALLRPILFCGAERKSAIIYGTLALIVAASSNFKAPGIYIGPVIFIICHLFFVYLAKKDPQMIALYLRHIKYSQPHFPARGSASVKADLIQVRPTVDHKR